ncbi:MULTISPECIES: hypothetical protein [Gelidibacter]|jgi:hypothetical protein|uniref:Addiction module component n=1 Tax=Gelidibacter pelagius TaxID=2819985 RepID=A0ABS3SM81_9FLAO|nr:MULTISPECIES: hypothetical protein [Gelidibacter]MBO3096794.1 hypothetical protein [Gelidibacter pelagius]
MTTITVKNGRKLSKTNFDSWEEVQAELILMQEDFELGKEHAKILKERENEADNAVDDGYSWEELKADFRRKNA